MSRYVSWSMMETIERIDAYLNSKHTSGETDSLGREKPFFNIVTAATNIWYRATDIDRKNIQFIPKNNSSVVLAFIANVILQNWMDDNSFGSFLNLWGRALARYGSAVAKFVEKEGELVPSVIPWNRYVADPVQFDALPRIEKFYLTPAQLRMRVEYDQDVVDNLLKTRQVRRTLDKQQKDNMNEFVELYEVHGDLDTRYLEEDPDTNLAPKDVKYRQQMHVISYVQGSKKGEYDDFTLFSGKEAKDPYLKADLIEEDGRTLGIGAVEYLFDAQWMANHTVKNMKDTLDIASKLIFQTSDSNFIGRNVLSAIETGEIQIHALNQPLTRVANDKPDIAALQNFGTMWQRLGQELTSTNDALRGVTPPSGTALGTVQITTSQGLSLFELMTENKGLAIEEMMREFVIPFIKKQLKHKDQIVAILDAEGIQQIDALYIPSEAVKRFNAQATETMVNGGIPSPFQPGPAQQQIKSELSQQGNKRFFTPSDLDDKTWSELFSDFEWDSIRVEVTNENDDKQTVLTTLNTVFQTIASNPTILENQNAMSIFSAILRETGSFSPLQLTVASTPPVSTPQTVLRETIDFKDLPPDGQQQLAQKAGMDIQPPQPQMVGGLSANQQQ